MSNIVPFNTTLSLPAEAAAHYTNAVALTQTMAAGLTSRFNQVKLQGQRMQLVVSGAPASEFLPAMDFVIVGASPNVERQFYKGAYKQGVEARAPDCFSRDGVAPAADATLKQGVTCASCPMNQKGSAADGSGGRACRFFKRAVVVKADDISGPAFSLRISASSMFGEGAKGQNLFTFSEYSQMLVNARTDAMPNGIPACFVVTRISMDQSASVPVTRYSPIGYVAPELMKVAAERGNADDVQELLSYDTMVADAPTQPAAAPATQPPVAPVMQPPVAPVMQPPVAPVMQPPVAPVMQPPVAPPVAAAPVVQPPPPPAAPAKPARAPDVVQLLANPAVTAEWRTWAGHPQVTDDQIRAQLAAITPAAPAAQQPAPGGFGDLTAEQLAALEGAVDFG